MRVYLGYHLDPLVVGMLIKEGYQGTRNLWEADVAILTGGADINPKLYQERVAGAVNINDARDKAECAVYEAAVNMDIPVVGICRGAQLINVLNGGSLWQDVGDAHRKPHYIKDLETGRVMLASSTHHQMMRVHQEEGRILALAVTKDHKAVSLCKYKQNADTRMKVNPKDSVDPEVVLYEKTRSLCFQPHPEHAGYGILRKYFFSLVEQLVEDASK